MTDLADGPGALGADTILVFLHIGRTGGLTLGRTLARQFAPDETLPARADDPASALGVWSTDQLVDRLGSMTALQRDKLRYLAGHFMFGVHTVLPRAARYITLVRDPVDRVVSSYYYTREQPGIPTRQAILGLGLDLHDYVAGGYGLDTRDYQTRVLSGLKALDATWAEVRTAAARPLEPEVLERARRNIDEWFLLAAPTECFDEALLILKLVYRWPIASVLYEKTNQSRGRPGTAELPAAVASAIRERNPYDVQLYEHVRERFATQARRWKPQLDFLLPRFRELNRLRALPVGGAFLAEQDAAIRRLCADIDQTIDGSSPDAYRPLPRVSR